MGCKHSIAKIRSCRSDARPRGFRMNRTTIRTLDRGRAVERRFTARPATGSAIRSTGGNSLHRRCALIVVLLALPVAGAAQAPRTAEVLLRDLACGNCHGGIPVPSNIQDKAPDLTQAGVRYNPDYIFNYLKYPVRVRQNLGASRMPNFRLSDREALALTYYLVELAREKRDPSGDVVSKTYAQVRAAHPEVTAAMGKDLFYGLNCLACHRQASMSPWKDKPAPDLTLEGARVKREWLAAFLRKPAPVRPFGFYPGTGGRHPDFGLTQDEADTLTAWFWSRRKPFAPDTTLRRRPLSVFSMNKARRLIDDKLACLGCHRLGDRGGRIGPDLSSLSGRLQDDYVFRMLRDPQSVAPGTVMPKIAMTDSTRNLIANYLLQQQLPKQEAAYLSLIDDPPLFQEGVEKREGDYLKYCASCHGRKGDGDGFNAKYLARTPAKHSDAAYMSTRPDGTLYDGIAAGGYILNRSNLMPAWGFTLDPATMEGLVAYIRELCACEGPEWSRDDRVPLPRGARRR